MELDKIRALNDSELAVVGNDAAEQLFRLRFQKSLGNQEGLKKLRTLKLDIARTQTIARERTLSAEKVSTPAKLNVAPAASKRTERKKAKKV